MIYVDLHMHTLHSDGTDSPVQVVQAAKLKGLGRIAIADHDNLAGYFEAVPEAKKWGIELVPGVEISTLQGHLLALNFDPHNKDFLEFIDYSREIQHEVCEQRVEVLKDYGVPISFEQVKKDAKGLSVGKAAIFTTMLTDENCKKYLKEKHGDYDVRDLWDFYFSAKGITNNIEKKRWVEWKEAADKVHGAGGVVIFPHPPLKAKDPSDVEDLLKFVDGIEVQPKYEEGNKPFIKYAQDNGLFLTYGSDWHGSAFPSVMLGKGDNAMDDSVLGEIKK